MVNEKRSERISFYSHWYSVHVSSIYFHWILSFWQTFALDTPSKCWIRVYFHSTPKSFTKKTAATIEIDVEQNYVSFISITNSEQPMLSCYMIRNDDGSWHVHVFSFMFHIKFMNWSQQQKNRRKITRKREYPCDFEWKSDKKNLLGWAWCKNFVFKITWKWNRHLKVGEVLFLRPPIWMLFENWCWFI